MEKGKLLAVDSEVKKHLRQHVLGVAVLALRIGKHVQKTNNCGRHIRTPNYGREVLMKRKLYKKDCTISGIFK